jgi:hypothetical protein
VAFLQQARQFCDFAITAISTVVVGPNAMLLCRAMKNIFKHSLRLLSLLILLHGMFALAVAQESSKAVIAKGLLSVDKVRQGSSFQVAVVLEIDPAFHINANKPSDPGYIATSLEAVKQENISFSEIIYPKAEAQQFEFSPDPLLVYSGRIVIKFRAQADSALATGAQTIKTKLRYQACTNNACYAPKTIEVSIPIEVVKASEPVVDANKTIFAEKEH